MTKLRYVYDIETNGFMPTVDKIWMLVLTNVDTNEVKTYVSKTGNPNDIVIHDGLEELDRADVLIGHNIIGYDNVVLKHLTGWEPKPHQKVMDTWILSLLNQYKRDHKHGLEGWGSKFSLPKLPFDKFDEYSDEMLTYCIRDVELNVKVYKHLVEEANKIIAKFPAYKKGIEVEMEFAKIESDIRNKGWVFDMAAAQTLLSEINNKLDAIEMVLEPRIGMRCIKTDGKDEFKEPAWRKDGCYTVATVKHFNLSQESGRTTRPIEGAYCRISFEQGKVGSIEVVKDWLYSMGWVPDEWNVEKINGKFVNKSPKITASSLEKLGADAMLVSEYYTIRSRKGILEGWIEAVKESPDNRLHGRMWTIGTPTFRCRHEVVANIPSVDSVYGKEMRALLISEPGTSIVGADSAGNQMRGLCHYINNDDFTNEVINGDVHQKNADILSGVHPCPRRTAKPWLYAYLFGAGPGKLGIILTGKTDVKIGKESASLFETSIPGLKELKDKLSNLFDKTSGAFGKDKAFIRGLDGRMVFVSSQHQVLNYLLQTAEGITCKAAIVWLTKELNKRNIPYYYTLHYHDELVVVCKDEHAEEIKQLSIQAFIEAPKDFGVMCMGGDAHIGKTYAEVH
jgi:DNA polymerase I-like protein with 3'-5' exonuclease and polymerase domains